MIDPPLPSARRRAPHVLALLLAAAVAVAPASPLAAQRVKPESLAEEYQRFLEEAAPLMKRKEVRSFLRLREDHQRDRFIRAFWLALDPDPETAVNEFKLLWDARVEAAREEYRDINEDRARVFMLQGLPGEKHEPSCTTLWPIEAWVYQNAESVGSARVVAIFVDDYETGRYRLWHVDQNPQILARELLATAAAMTADEMEGLYRWLHAGSRALGGARLPFSLADANNAGYHERELLQLMVLMYRHCFSEASFAALLLESIAMDRIVPMAQARLFDSPRTSVREEQQWLADFEAALTDLPDDAGLLDVESSVQFVGREGSRTVVELGLRVLPDETEEAASTSAAAEAAAHAAAERTEGTAETAESVRRYAVNGEVFRTDDAGDPDELFEDFRYLFEIPGDPTAPAPLSVRRLLRPGEYRMVLRVEDAGSGRFHREELEVVVPRHELAEVSDPEVDAVLDRVAGTDRGSASASADRVAGEPGELRVELGTPDPRPYLDGYTRFEAKVSGGQSAEVARVAFALDGAEKMTRTRPPFSLELDLGEIPRPRTIRATAYDASGAEIAFDELVVNQGNYRFAAKLISPEPGRRLTGRVLARVEVVVPEDAELDRVELYLDDRRLATLYQAPFEQELHLETDEIVLLRASAYLADGNFTEDAVLLNGPAQVERIAVRMVELYARALRDGRPVVELERDSLTVTEEGEAQQILRFERVEDLPLQLAILIDTSASMKDRLEEARAAAHAFLQSSVRAQDRVAIVTFHERPNLRVDFTGDLREMTEGLRGLAAGRGTAFFDSLVFALYQFQGMKGQRAVLVLTDGKDEDSRLDFDRTLEFARRAGVTVYPIGLEGLAKQMTTRRQLDRIAEESGGRTVFVEEMSELEAVYREIEQELRSRWLIAYQSTIAEGDQEFRRVDVEAADPGIEIETVAGYYP
ncbi:MAG TPA: VWA domain-containing protein [Thermoanaerobaculia bacterium]|nr:VWA domain-containing protein [Thermoanaerobaculia bacterium]